jgi:hypothetical protein
LILSLDLSLDLSLILCRSFLELTLYSPLSSLIAGNAEKIFCNKPLRIKGKEEK